MMDILKAFEEKAFWGHEFLTWLWYCSEETGGDFELPQHGPVALWIEDRLVLGSLDSESKENILKEGDVSRSAEAAAALSVGKKVLEARFGLIREDREWSFVVKGDTLDLTSVRMPRVLADEDDDWHTTAFVRLGLARECLDVLEALFGEFVKLRLSDAWSRVTLPAMVRWVEVKEGA